MCGIAGLFLASEEAPSEARLARMLDLLAHRGPDGRGAWSAPGVGLGHVRLAILDLTDRAAQPMVSRCGRYVLTYNGEVYNFRALRSLLEERGIEPRSTGDTEVLLELLAALGPADVLPRLEGFFAFGLYDREERSLVLARDRHGIKPLYTRPVGGNGVAFASEMRPLLEPDEPVDQHAVSAALLGWGMALGERTLFRDVTVFPAGCWARISGDGPPEPQPFFRATDFIDPDLHRELRRTPPAEVLERIDAAFESSIDLRMVSDAPLACLASGGVDSNLVAACVSRRTKEPLRLYHAAVAHDSELPWARAIADHLGLELRTVEVTDEAFLDHLPLTTLHAELPLIYHANSVPFFLVCRLASGDGIKVMLTGEGSDEYFLGYPWFIIRRYTRAVGRVLARLQAGMHAVFPRGGTILWPRRADSIRDHLTNTLFRYLHHDLHETGQEMFRHREKPWDRAVAVETCTLVHAHLGTLLHRNDRLGMASGIESRFPFLGHELARLAMNLPSEFKIRVVPRFYNVRHPFHVDKWAVREMAVRRLPERFAYRPKKGFPVSIASRLRVRPEWFAGGCVAEWFGLTPRAFEELERRASRPWVFRLLLLEVWGQLLHRGRSPEEVRDRLRRHVSTRA